MALQEKGIWGKVQKGSKCRQEFHIPKKMISVSYSPSKQIYSNNFLLGVWKCIYIDWLRETSTNRNDS